MLCQRGAVQDFTAQEMMPFRVWQPRGVPGQEPPGLPWVLPRNGTTLEPGTFESCNLAIPDLESSHIVMVSEFQIQIARHYQVEDFTSCNIHDIPLVEA